MKYTYKEIATSFELWGEYVDPNQTMSEDEFHQISVNKKIKMQEAMYGKQGYIED